MISTHFTPTISPKFLQPLLIFNKTALIISHMKWAWDFLLHLSLFQSSHTPSALLQSIDSHSVRRTARVSDECAVCLCSIDAGNEIRELKCSHIFHGVCLERWVVGYGHWSCPLCRNHLKIVPRNGDGFDCQVLVFKYSEFSSRDRSMPWWLR